MAIVWMILVQFAWMSLYKGEIVNVALNKPVSMSSRHNTDRFGPEKAVDGDTTGIPPSIIHTNAHNTSTWWWVNLQTRVQDATVKIYFRTDERRRRNGTQFYTSVAPFSSNSYPQGQLCHSIIGTNIEDVVSVNCSGTWQYLMVYTNTKNVPTDTNPVLDFGEVQVLACPLGKYGVNCRSDCISRHCAVNTSTCNRTTGDCPLTDGCTPGWRGIDCSQACVVDTYGQDCSMFCGDRKCKSSSSSCDHVTGQCDDGCKPGWNGTDCIHECPSRTYGESCSKDCVNRHCLTSSETCDHVTGACIPEGCGSGWQGIDCGRPCRSETLGKDCMENCGHCNGTCEAVDGRCLWGCQEGYHGIRCQEELPTGMTAVIAGVVGAVSMLFVIGGVLICLLRLGRLQWMKASRSDDVRQSTEMSDVSSPPVIHHAVSDRPQSMSGHVFNNDYEVINSKTKSDKDVYDVITDEKYKNV